MQEFDDNQLLTLFKNGSLEAYEVLFKKYYKLLCLQAVLFLKDEAEAEDLVVELFIEIWDKKIYRGIEKSLKAYLYRSVRNKCINKAKKNKIAKLKQEEYKEYSMKENESTWLEQRDLGASTPNINNVLLELPTQRLRAFTLVYLEQKKYQEAADEMGLSLNSLKTHLRLALLILRNKLKKF